MSSRHSNYHEYLQKITHQWVTRKLKSFFKRKDDYKICWNLWDCWPKLKRILQLFNLPWNFKRKYWIIAILIRVGLISKKFREISIFTFREGRNGLENFTEILWIFSMEFKPKYIQLLYICLLSRSLNINYLISLFKWFFMLTILGAGQSEKISSQVVSSLSESSYLASFSSSMILLRSSGMLIMSEY